MPEYVLSHHREFRTFVTIKADDDSQALAKAKELQRRGVTDPDRTWIPPDWFIESDYEDNDAGEWEIREVRQTEGEQLRLPGV